MTRPLCCLALCLSLAACASEDAASSAREVGPREVGAPVVLMTDFGLRDDAVGLMRGVIAARAPSSQIHDLTHQVPRFDVRAGSRLLGESPGLYPPGSVFVIVVDPGVGTERRAIVARLNNGTMLVAPDNGVLSEALRRHGPAEVREVVNRSLLIPARSATFHGRDVFAPVGGALAGGGADFGDVGPVISDYVRLEPSVGRIEQDALVGEIEAVDLPFGNVWTNLPAQLLGQVGWAPGTILRVRIGDRSPLVIPLANTFGEVERGAPLVYPNSRGRVAFALNLGDFARKHEVEAGQSVRIERLGN